MWDNGGGISHTNQNFGLRISGILNKEFLGSDKSKLISNRGLIITILSMHFEAR